MMRRTAVLVVGVLAVGVAGAVFSQDASASFFDKLKAATHAVEHAGKNIRLPNQAANQTPNQAASQTPNGQHLNAQELKLQKQIAAEPYCPPGSAICSSHVLDKLVACQSSVAGKLEHLAADRLEKKLKISPKLNARERAVWQADITALRAVGYEKPYQPPDPKNSLQYTNGLTRDEYTAIQTTFVRYRQQVFINCERKSKNGLSTPAETEKYVATLRAKMPKPYEVSSIPLQALPSPFPKSDEELEQEREGAASARRAKAQQLANKCNSGSNKIRMTLTADKMQQKLDNTHGLSAKERADFVADIKATRAAAAADSSSPKPVDPKNPYRYITRLTMDDQMAINKEFQAQYVAYLQKCTKQ